MLLEKLSNEIGVSGDEGLIRQLIIPAIKPHVDEVTVDTMGNVYAYKSSQSPGKTSEPTVMVTAHMDEIGLMITQISKDGMLRFTTVGGIDPRLLPGKTVMVGRNKVVGVIGLEAMHKVSGSQRDQAPTIKSLAIDIGASSKEAAQAKVSLGDYATFNTEFGFFNNNSDDQTTGLIKGKALDNRVGCAMLVELLQQDHPINVIGVFTVQEEIGTRGAMVAAHRTDPDWAIVLECTTADDLPAADQEIRTPRLGNGPCVTIMDRSFIAHPALIRMVEAAAAKHQIPYQYKNPGMGGTDAGAIHKSRMGIPAITLATPSRYIHSPVALVDMTDYWHCINLTKATLAEISAEKE